MADSAFPQVGRAMSPSQLKTVDQLIDKVKQLRQTRMPLEKQWRLNLAFYKGKQYSYYPPRSDRLESLAVEEGSMPRHRVRLVSNQIMPGTHTLLAQLTKTKPQLRATPGSGDQHELKAAQMAQSLLEYWWQDFQLDEKLDEALLWSIVASAGYWKINWDPFASKQMRFLLGPDGKPIIDESLKTAFKAELKKYGVEPKEKIVYMGDIKVEVFSPFDIYLDTSAKVFEDCKFAICRHALDPDEIKSRWGVTVQPNKMPTSPDAVIPFQNQANPVDVSVRDVYIGYFKPTAAMPNGRYVAWLDGPEKKIIQDDRWPYPFNDLPIVKFPGMRVPGGVYDDAVVTHAISLQKELNRTISQIVEYKNYTINPVMTAPVGSMRTARTTEPGQVITYSPVGNLKPEFENLPTLPPYVFDHLSNISQRLQDVFLSAEVIQGKVPPNVEAGVAIDLLQEQATDKLAPIIKLVEMGLARAGQQMLSLAQKYYIEPRLLKIRGSSGGLQVKQFQQADISGNISVHAEVGSGLPRTRAGRQARIESLIQLGVVPPTAAYKYFDLADLKGLGDKFAAQEDFAYRNVDNLLQGIPVNPESQAQAFQAVQMGMNPQTQMPIQSPQEAEQIVHDAGLDPPPGIDYDTHLDIMSLFMASVEFSSLPTNIRQDFFTYYNNLLNAKFSLMPMPEPQAPRVSYQIKSTAGPTVGAEILKRAGVQTTPQEMAEPPLETWVSDSIDKPDTDAAGPGQEANQLSEAAKTELEASIADAQSKQNALNTQNQHTADMLNQGRQAQQDSELHQHKVREAKAKADLAVRKAKAPLTSSKPTKKAA
jgi:hypothetical protein